MSVANPGPDAQVTAPDGHLLVSTMNELPGYEITEILGNVYGFTVRSRDAVRTVGAGLKSIVGGELKTFTKNIESSREEAVVRMIRMAMGKGADGVVAMRYDSGNQEGFGEICAYGTAVKCIRKFKLAKP